MGPNTHREERLDNILNEKLSNKWNDETEAKYLESVRNRAITKVRAMLLQAKRRSDEIIAEAEREAKGIHHKADKAYTDLLDAQKKTQSEYDSAFELASQNAHKIMQDQLLQDKMKLGESTAVVLLSIHQQLQNIYDAWRDELRLLTLEAIQVGTGWVADSKREEILASMLDECVRKLIDKKDYTVRVHPSDGALVTQVLENSRHNSWSMESSSDLDAGSLEVEDKHSIVKNSSKERKKFVQDILDNLILPTTEADDTAIQAVTNTLMNEMQNNHLLAQTSDPDQYNEQNDNNAQYANNEQNNLNENNFNENNPSNEINEQEIPQDNNPKHSPENTFQNTEENQTENVLDNASSENQESEQELNSLPNPPEIENPPTVNPNAEAESIVDEFLNDFGDEEKPQPDTIDNIDTPQDIQQPDKPSSKPQDTKEKDSAPLSQDVADDLLAEMGF